MEFIPEHKHYETVINGLDITINESEMSEETVAMARVVAEKYPGKADAVAEYLSAHENIIGFYGNISKEDMAKKLHQPVIRVDSIGGVLSFCNHELDNEHIIEVEFGGLLEEFYYVVIDG